MMNLSADQIASLLLKKVSGQLTAGEEVLLEQLKAISDAHRDKVEEYTDLNNIKKGFQLFAESERNASGIIMPAIDPDQGLRTPDYPAHRVHFLRRWWWAAAVILIAGTAITISVSRKRPFKDQGRLLASAAAIKPGSNKATLTLGDGHVLILDSISGGQVANQGNVQVIKTASDQIEYNPDGSAGREAVWNTMTTPRGGQYQLVLPDKTKVWLNAESSISFPTVFSGNKRQVKVTGELYFEIAGNKSKPFIVDVNGKSSVEVLGTRFNVNAYTDENVLRTTLIEGSVRVGQNDEKIILKPGQQAEVDPADAGSRIKVLSGVDLAQTLAWKNGIFDFNGADLKTVMRQLERWYGIQVHYKSSMSNISFEGKMYRNVNLSDVLEVLQEMGVRFELDGNNLIVL